MTALEAREEISFPLWWHLGVDDRDNRLGRQEGTPAMASREGSAIPVLAWQS